MQKSSNDKGYHSTRAALTARDHRYRLIILVIAVLSFLVCSVHSPAPAAATPVQQTIIVPTHPLFYGFHKITLQDRVVEEAKKYIGTPYVAYASDPSVGFDCSGFTMYVYSKFGIDLPHSAHLQLEENGRAVSEANAEPGDLVLMPGHVGIWMGHGMMLDSPKPGGEVGIRPIWASQYTIFKVHK